MLLQLMSWVFLPVFIASRVCTVPEYMNKRFGGQRIQVYLALLSLVLYIFTKISVDLYSGALFINLAFKWNIYGSIMALLVLTAAFTITGGLAAVIYTDTLQFFIMIAGALVVMSKAFYEVGGYEALQYKYMQAVPKLRFENTSCGIPRADSWIMLRDPINSDLPWPAFLLGQTPASIWYWCADQMMIQRTLASKNLSHAKGATLFAAYAKILPFFIIILPGMISRTLFPDDVACVLPEECMRACGSRFSCLNSAYPRLVVGIMPAGLKGIILAVMLAALMTDLTSIFNSASTMFSLDLWRRIRPKAKSRELLIVGKVCIVALVVVSVAWVPVIEEAQSGQLFIYIQKVGAYLSPPIACVYSMAILWKRMNEQGAFCGLMVGLVVGVTRMILDFSYPPPACWQDESRPFIVRLNFMYFAALLFWMTAITAGTVSLMTQPPDSFMLIRTTFWTRFDKTEREDDRRRKVELEDDIRWKVELEDDRCNKVELEDDRCNKVELEDDIRREAELEDASRREVELESVNRHEVELEDDSHREVEFKNDSRQEVELEDDSHREVELEDDSRREVELEDDSRREVELEDDSHRKGQLEEDIPHRNGKSVVSQKKSADKLVVIEAGGSKCLACTVKFFLWLCGLETEENGPETEDNTLNTLEENPRTRLFLNINLVLVLAVGVGLFAYYSVDPFPNNFVPGNYTSVLLG